MIKMSRSQQKHFNQQRHFKPNKPRHYHLEQPVALKKTEIAEEPPVILTRMSRVDFFANPTFDFPVTF
jgi:hypothetical protein